MNIYTLHKLFVGVGWMCVWGGGGRAAGCVYCFHIVSLYVCPFVGTNKIGVNWLLSISLCDYSLTPLNWAVYSVLSECYLTQLSFCVPGLIKKRHIIISYAYKKLHYTPFVRRRAMWSTKWDSLPCNMDTQQRLRELQIKHIFFYQKLEQVDGVPSHIPAPAASHISMHIKIPNAFLQSSSISLLKF